MWWCDRCVVLRPLLQLSQTPRVTVNVAVALCHPPAGVVTTAVQ